MEKPIKAEKTEEIKVEKFEVIKKAVGVKRERISFVFNTCPPMVKIWFTRNQKDQIWPLLKPKFAPSGLKNQKSTPSGTKI